ncbi:hypothetical protein F951_01112 [Acinetobacter soli CIP 110264]|uniref:HTH iclR-type domain-containing protein n=3 Tax=Gammaproteobacteria TaxID=1236 RepID=A0ABN0JY98_9GAMM|nr:hypothetical protein F951_01112 [Acinetobacter soli CIP 110264]ENV60568.1 hypothetical protein F950_01650 [Acinetobacter soli NIPH 2899]MCE6008739.1 helix-turn-helix domain-containing protein [Acinetobacter soli]
MLMINESRSIQSLERGMLILEYIAQQHGTAQLSDISKALNLSKSTVHGLLNTLAALGYISREGTAYTLGLRLNSLSKQIIHVSQNIKENYWPLMQWTAKLSGQTCYLACPCGSKEYLYLAALNHNEEFDIKKQFRSPRESLTASAIGKVILANSLDLRRSLARANLLNPQIVLELEHIQKNGYAIDFENAEVGLNCFAIPLFQNGKLIAALGISGKSQYFTPEKMFKILPKLLQKI